MVMEIIKIRPNNRETYQNRVENLCELLKDKDDRFYRSGVFLLLCTPAKAFKRTGLRKFSECFKARSFLNAHYAGLKALKIINELDAIYEERLSDNEIDDLRGAVGEVFSYLVCKKIYNNAEIEVQVKIDSWQSGSIDTAGCNNRKGHCLQSKSSPRDISSIRKQKSDFDIIFSRTKGKAIGAFVTYIEKGSFEQVLNINGIDPKECTVYGRTDLVNLEDRLLE